MKLQHISTNKSNHELVIITSGISGGPDASIVREATKFFAKSFDTLNIEYVSDDFKNINNITAPFCHADIRQEFDRIMIGVNHKRYKSVIFVSHSFQALISLYLISTSTLLLGKSVSLVMWDPSSKESVVNNVNNFFKFENNIFDNALESKNRVAFSKNLIDEIHSRDIRKELSSLKNKTLIITAFNAGEHIISDYKNLAVSDITYKTIKNCGHNFGSYKARRDLFRITKSFILDKRINKPG